LRVFRLGSVLILAAFGIGAQDLAEFEKKVTEFSLPNGLHFILAERHDAPVVSFHTYVNAGSVDDPAGATGIAHMFEHMAFKGTDGIGTKDWPGEKAALQAVEDAYDLLDAERNKGPKADSGKIDVLQLQLKRAIDKAQTFVEPNEYSRVIEENGGVGLNAGTSLGNTEYYYSLPSNRIELWFLMESQRFLHPVFREFYKERDVVMEERRMRIESNPQGKLLEDFLATAFEAHPYRNPGVGWPSDIASLRVPTARAFFDEYYAPANINIAIVGDVNPAEARRMAERYFGPLPARPLPPLLHTVEPPQRGPKTAVVDSPTQPLLIVGYKRPDQYDPDDAVFDVIQMILSSGRTGLMYKQLVEQKVLSLEAEAGATFPDGKYPNLFVFLLVPARGHTVEDNQKALDDLLVQFEAKKVDEETLARVKTKVRAGLIRRLGSNAGLASLLTTYYATYGDWRKLFTSISDLNKVTADDVQRVAVRYFKPSNRTVAYTVPPTAPLPPGRKSAPGGRP
jgi:predicted Zn-dependent peptidase